MIIVAPRSGNLHDDRLQVGCHTGVLPTGIWCRARAQALRFSQKGAKDVRSPDEVWEWAVRAATVRYAPGMKSRWRFWFRRERRKAARLLADPAQVVQAADHAAEKARGVRGPLARVWDDLQAVVRLVRAWGQRKYRGVGAGTLVLLLAALMYFVSPIDAIVDAIPLLGLIDDAAVLAWVFGQVRAELDAFRTWEARRDLPLN